MASKVAFVLVLALYVTTGRVPGRCEVLNPDLEVTTGLGRAAAKPPWRQPLDRPTA